ncbi:Glutaredoxin [Candidatus Promineifilum breve]|uniref:Glutaredoxin n=2 Tax=Candidatus Promineifilum breve TaxID=1806508 RepID=A0A160T5N3_9CHLR|nr:Glutaredoxin [Candidatus Promineifilum breve]
MPPRNNHRVSTMPTPLTLYGANDCDDTDHVIDRLRAWNIPFREVILERDPDAERFVIFINGGYRSTPTLVFGDGRLKTILTEPTDEELTEVLGRAGYVVQP